MVTAIKIRLLLRTAVLSIVVLAALCRFAISPASGQSLNTDKALQASAVVASDRLLTEGKNFFLANDYASALNSFRQFEAVRPNNFPVHFWIGLILDQNGDAAGALDQYRQSLTQAKTVDMDSAELRVNLGNTLSKMGYSKEPLADYQRAIVIDPMNPLAHLGLSKCLIDSGDYAAALKAVDRFGTLGGRDINVPLLRGLALAGQGNYAEARQQLRNYLSFTNSSRLPTNPALTALATKILNEIESAPVP